MRHQPTKRMNSTGRTPAAGRSGAAVLLLLAGTALWGCEADSWMDPSVLGRWEHTPTVMPVIDRIAAIEREDVAYVETSDPTPEDLIPVAAEYRITTGDGLVIRIRDLLRMGEEAEFERMVDRRGYIELPRLPPIRLQGLTAVQARDVIAKAVRDADLLKDPTVTVLPMQQRQQTFSAMGSVQTPGTYFIPSPDYRLLQALTAAGGFSEGADAIYVIRQVPLGEAAGTGPEPTGEGAAPAPGAKPEDIIDLIKDLSTPRPGEKPSPGVFSEGSPSTGRGVQPPAGDQPPPIGLPDSPTRPQPAPPAPAPAAGVPGAFQWVFQNGQWVKVPVAPAEGAGERGPEGTAPGDVLAAQRVIRIPTAALIAGSARYNIVVRPGDIIRVPSNVDQFFYIGGQISRPGVYTIPRSGITLLRALMAAGDLSGIAIPERVDLTRKTGKDQQATIRLNLRAIAECTAPDIYLKNDDMINIGTNFFAYPLAVLRNGIRTSYGFGFLLDRNFGNDVFGAPPDNFQR